jgi:hypothetical protein
MVDTPLGLTSVWDNNGDSSLILHYQVDKIHFKQTLFSSYTEIVQQNASSTLPAPAEQRHSVHKNDHVYYLSDYVVINIIVEVVKYNLYRSLLNMQRYYCQNCDQHILNAC